MNSLLSGSAALQRIDLLRERCQRGGVDPSAVEEMAGACQVAGLHQEALSWDDRRVEMGGDPAGVWTALFQKAHLLDVERLAPGDVVLRSYLAVYQSDPQRGLPLIYLARIYRETGEAQMAYSMARLALESLSCPADHKLDPVAYRITLPSEYALASLAIGRRDLALSMRPYLRKIANDPHFPEELTRLLATWDAEVDSSASGQSFTDGVDWPLLPFLRVAWWEHS